MFGDLWEQVKAHPLIWGGAVIVVIGALYLFTKSSSSAGTTQQFAFSYGPSDAQVAAGTQLQIAQVQANAATSIASSNATANQAAVGDYFSYLTTNSANALAADTLSTNATEYAAAQGTIQNAAANQTAQFEASLLASNQAVENNNNYFVQAQTVYGETGAPAGS